MIYIFSSLLTACSLCCQFNIQVLTSKQQFEMGLLVLSIKYLVRECVMFYGGDQRCLKK